MRAIVVPQFGPVETSLKMQHDVPAPAPRPGYAIIKVKAFGLNHAEMHMRRGEWAESMPIIGIECVGVLVSSLPDPNNDAGGATIEPGTPVATLMGGLGRTINGSYAEYTSARLDNVVPIPLEVVDGLGWAALGALPETFATAWTCLFRNLDLQSGERVLVRGASSAFGRAAVALALEKGAIVSGTVRSAARIDEFKALGLDQVFVEEGDALTTSLVASHTKFDKILDLVGNSTVMGSLTLVRRGGRVCLAGWLGGLDGIKEFNPLLQKMPSDVHLSFFGSFAFGEEGFPLNDVPLAEIARLVADGKFGKAVDKTPKRVWEFTEEHIREAHRVMEAGTAAGKMGVVIDNS